MFLFAIRINSGVARLEELHLQSIILDNSPFHIPFVYINRLFMVKVGYLCLIKYGKLVDKYMESKIHSLPPSSYSLIP